MNVRVRTALQKNADYHAAVAQEKAAAVGLKVEDFSKPADGAETPRRRRGVSTEGSESETQVEETSQNMSNEELVARMHHDAAKDLREVLESEALRPPVVLQERQAERTTRNPAVESMRQIRANRSASIAEVRR